MMDECRWCHASVDAASYAGHSRWHAANDLHREDCGAFDPAGFDVRWCNCGVAELRSFEGIPSKLSR